jgi:chromate transporter
MTSREFADLLALCQFLPGPTIINVAVVIGTRFRGPFGAIAGVTGLILPPAILLLFVGALYQSVHTNVFFQRGLAGIAAAAAGLLAATAVQMIRVLVRQRKPEPLLVLAVAFLAVGIARWSLPLVMVLLAPVSVALAWRRVR